MVTQSEAPQQASPNALKAQQPMTNGRADSGALATGASEPDIAWEMVKEECHDGALSSLFSPFLALTSVD